MTIIIETLDNALKHDERISNLYEKLYFSRLEKDITRRHYSVRFNTLCKSPKPYYFVKGK